MLAREVITDVFAEVSAFGIGRKKVLVLFRREVEIAINLAPLWNLR